MTSLTETTNTFAAKDGLNIFYRHFPAENKRCDMVITHGLGMNSNCYNTVVERLVPRGISIWAVDLRGHGHSDGRRGYINEFDEYLSDLKILVEHTKKEGGEGVKTFLLGDSMGGLIVLNFALKFPKLLDGVIAASPGLGGAKASGVQIKIIIAKILARIMPTFSLPHGLDFSKSCHDIDWVTSFKNDPLYYDRTSARLATELLSTAETTFQEIHKMTVPILMQVPGDDHLVDANTSKSFFDRLTLEDKTLHFYDTFYHFIFNEPSDMRAIALTDLANWIDAHI